MYTLHSKFTLFSFYFSFFFSASAFFHFFKQKYKKIKNSRLIIGGKKGACLLILIIGGACPGCPPRVYAYAYITLCRLHRLHYVRFDLRELMNAVAFHCSEDFQCIDALNGFLFLIGSGFTISLSTLT